MKNKEKTTALAWIVLSVLVAIILVCFVVISHDKEGVTQPVASTTQDSNSNTIPANPPAKLSNTEMCKIFSQKVADSNGSANNLFYSVQSYHYSSSDNVCYFELHYQMDTSIQGSKNISQVYSLQAESMSAIKSTSGFGLGATEADCIVPETYYYGATTDCKYHGLSLSTSNNYTYVIIKNLSDKVPSMSYSDYEALVQKRMNN